MTTMEPDLRCSLTAPRNGFVVNGKTSIGAGEMAEYVCDVQHTMIGINDVVCLSDGTLSSDPPACTCKYSRNSQVLYSYVEL